MEITLALCIYFDEWARVYMRSGCEWCDFVLTFVDKTWWSSMLRGFKCKANKVKKRKNMFLLIFLSGHVSLRLETECVETSTFWDKGTVDYGLNVCFICKQRTQWIMSLTMGQIRVIELHSTKSLKPNFFHGHLSIQALNFFPKKKNQVRWKISKLWLNTTRVLLTLMLSTCNSIKHQRLDCLNTSGHSFAF